MGTRTQEKEIDGTRFTVSQLPAMRALKLLNRIGRIAGPALGKAAEALKGGGLGDADVGALGSALGVLFEKLTDAELESMINELTDGASVCDPRPTEEGGTAGKTIALKPVFNLVMQGRTLVTFYLLAFAFEVNYGDFFDALRGKLTAQAVVKAAPESTSPSP